MSKIEDWLGFAILVGCGLMVLLAFFDGSQCNVSIKIDSKPSATPTPSQAKWT